MITCPDLIHLLKRFIAFQDEEWVWVRSESIPSLPHRLASLLVVFTTEDPGNVCDGGAEWGGSFFIGLPDRRSVLLFCLPRCWQVTNAADLTDCQWRMLILRFPHSSWESHGKESEKEKKKRPSDRGIRLGICIRVMPIVSTPFSPSLFHLPVVKGSNFPLPCNPACMYVCHSCEGIPLRSRLHVKWLIITGYVIRDMKSFLHDRHKDTKLQESIEGGKGLMFAPVTRIHNDGPCGVCLLLLPLPSQISDIHGLKDSWTAAAIVAVPDSTQCSGWTSHTLSPPWFLCNWHGLR